MSQPKCGVPGMPSTSRQQLTSQITAAVAEEKIRPSFWTCGLDSTQISTSLAKIYVTGVLAETQDATLIQVDCTVETKYLYKCNIF